jgi:hypothetical protein
MGVSRGMVCQASGQGALSEFGNFVAMRCMVAVPDEQQIPPLRFAPVGMTT